MLEKTSVAPAAPPETQTKVLYNADCPVCSFEIDHYARISQKHDLLVGFDNLNNPDCLRDWGIDESTAAKRLHVRKGQTVFGGIPAFLELWREMPGYCWLAKIVGLPGIYQLSVGTYDHVLAPALYRWHMRRVRRAENS